MNVSATTETVSEKTFAANRARGVVKFDVGLVEGATRRRELHESGSLRVRFPSPENGALSAVFINTAGGIAGGDQFAIDISSGEGARLTATTAAAEKIYRSHGPDSRIDVTLKAGKGAHLSWLPQETILFDGACVSRTVDIELHPAASLALCEIVVFGRAAMNETLRQGRFVDRWRMRRGGRLVFAETLKLDGDIAATLARSAVAKGGAAIGTALIVPGDEAMAERIRAASASFEGEVGISAWNGFAMVRVCAQNAAQARSDMTIALRAANVALPRLWMN